MFFFQSTLIYHSLMFLKLPSSGFWELVPGFIILSEHSTAVDGLDND